MRTQSTFHAKFWIGGSGSTIRKNGSDAIVVALYLISSPHSHMAGIFYCPISIISDETLIPVEKVKKILTILEDLNFIKYDLETKIVWVTTMAEFQGNITNTRDKKYKSIITHIKSLPDSFLIDEFADFYSIDDSEFKSGNQKITKEHNMGHTPITDASFPIHSYNDAVHPNASQENSADISSDFLGDIYAS